MKGGALARGEFEKVCLQRTAKNWICITPCACFIFEIKIDFIRHKAQTYNVK